MTTARVTQLQAAAALTAPESAEVRVTHEQVSFAGTGVAATVRVTHLYLQVAVSYCVPVTGRIITTPLNDETLRPQFIGHKVVVEVTTDPLDVTEAEADWTTMESGYCTRATLVDALTWEIGIGDTDRVEREADLFSTPDIVVGAPSLLLGGPIAAGWGATAPLETWEYPLFEVVAVESGRFLSLIYQSGPLPVLSGGDNRGYLNDIARPFATEVSDNVDRYRAYSYPDLVVQLYDPDTGALVASGSGAIRGVAGEFTPLSKADLTDTLLDPQWMFAIDWASSQPAANTLYRVGLAARRATPLTPFWFDGHPVDIATEVYDGLGIPYDAASVTSTKEALGVDLRLILRPTDGITALEMLESWLYGPFGFAYRLVAGVREFYPTRYRDAVTPPATTLTLADLRGEGTPYDLSDRGTVGKLIWEEQGYRFWEIGLDGDPGSTRPLDALITRKAVATYLQSDANAPPYLGTQTYAYPGFVVETVASSSVAPPTYKGAVAEELFYRWGRGTAEVTLPLLPGFAEQIGDFVISEIDYSPIPEADQTPITVRPKDYPARTPRQVLQLVKRSDSPAGVDAVFQVVGPVAQDVTDALGALPVPTLTIVADGGHPLNAALITVTNWATIQGDLQNRVDVEYGTGGSEPTTWSAAGTLATAVSLGVVGTPLFPAGTHFWTRARTWNTDGRVGAWSDVEDVTLDDLDPPTSFAGDPITNTQAVTYTWVNGDAVTPLVLRYLAPSASEWVTFAWLPAGTTRLVYTMPAPSTTYDVEIFHRQALEFVSESAHVEITLTTDVAGGALNAPTAPTVTTGNGRATFCVSVGDAQATAVLYQVAPETAGGTYTTWETFATRTVAGLGRLCADYTIPQQQSLFDPLRNRYYSFRALHTAPGFTDSTTTTPVVADAWAQSSAPPPIEGSYAEGSLLVALADGTLAPLPIGASTEVLTSDGSTASWEPATGGITGVEILAEGASVGTRPALNLIMGAGVTLTVTDNNGDDRVDVTVDAVPTGPDAVPASPDAMDDEFTGTSGLWTWNNQGGASVTVAGGRLQLDCPTNAGNNWRHYYQALPGSGAWEFRAKFVGRFPAYIWHLMLGLRNSSTSDFIAVGRSYAGAYFAPHVEKWTDNTTYSSNPYITNSYFELMHNPYYVAISYDTTDLRFLWSNSGEEGTFIALLKETPATFIGAGMDQICLSLMVNDASVAGRGWCYWFRRTT